MSTDHDAIPSHAQLLASFDQLVGIGAIAFAPPQVKREIHQGLPFEFLVSYGQGKKELLGTDSNNDPERSPGALVEPGSFGPGSDIGYDGRLVIARVRGRHVLILNLYPIVRPQLLLLTLDSYRKQDESLDQDDLASAYLLLEELSKDGTPYYAFFNCSRTGGASRQHKHIQILPREHNLFPDLPHYSPGIVPFEHFLTRFDEPFDHRSDSSIFESYHRLLTKALESLSLPAQSVTCPHNVIMTTEWLLVIPRRKSEYSSSIPIPNAPSMVGSVWLSSPERFEEWQRLGPLEILKHCGVSQSL